ncbi:4'-phosphopantetheinyl transferase EntD (siderophore biosynthesis) [Roseovarius nanhaiticus]|uniref:Enterobactin synthase component D n=1 Tax=Roseovarius nanhaiticus TaxID=573024 RepID=A0A1N7HIL8_9RHOB|nr:4'-phosphopantetheinyl transferase superfamily protein [Roseovarius nanhaiticus]SEK91666.1 4'-phosphopantetheinyl transferase EntD (siderophore biosynthesis) [Roseovarius nanhaiticus]SIS24719.1 4'-phosphopantetheinyl transferase EntD (siderophore biosynthesis) [Roseovarius nanhaiticus]
MSGPGAQPIGAGRAAPARAISRKAALHALFPQNVTIALSDPQAPQPAPWPEEAEAIRWAVPARAREFAAGRAASRVAMALMGHASRPVPAGPDRAPIWPDGLTGSLSHTSSLCIAALAPLDQVRAIGVDLEDALPVPADLIPDICTLAERAWLACQPEAERGLLAKLIFSAKECAYKCQYPLTRTLFDFNTLEVTPDLDTGQFEATFVRGIGDFNAGACLSGRFVMHDDLIACGMVLARRPRWGLGL